MNWIDIIALIAILLVAYQGYKMGLIRAAFMIIGVFLAMLLAAQISGPVSGWLTDSVKSDAVATVIAYAIVGGAIFAGSLILGNLLSKMLKTLLLGWVDKLGGLAAGAVAGFLIGGAFVAVLARLAFLVPESFDRFSPVDVREGLHDSLLDSAFVPAYIELYDFLPAKALGMVPGDFDTAIERLDADRQADRSE